MDDKPKLSALENFKRDSEEYFTKARNKSSRNGGLIYNRSALEKIGNLGETCMKTGFNDDLEVYRKTLQNIKIKKSA